MSKNVKFVGMAAIALAVSASAAFAHERIGAKGLEIKVRGNIEQEAINYNYVNNAGEINIQGANYGGVIKGHGNSANVSASGASSVISVTSIKNDDWSRPKISTKAITQTSDNHGRIDNGGRITAGNIYGHGNSASISASGATSAIAVASIADKKVTSLATGCITQIAYNHGDVTNGGSIAVGKISGNGNSASIGASGATAAISVSITKGSW